MWGLILCMIFVYVAEVNPWKMKMPRADKNTGLLYRGRMSTFGGPFDRHLKRNEGLALYRSAADRPSMFLPHKVGRRHRGGLARRLNPEAFYIAMRWDYRVTPKDFLKKNQAIVINPKNGRVAAAWPADWGPHRRTGKAIDLSPGIARHLGLRNGNTVEVVVPKPSTT